VARVRTVAEAAEEAYWTAQRAALAAAIEGGYVQKQGRPGEYLPYRVGSRLAFLNPRKDQMDALARWAAVSGVARLFRGSPPSVNPLDPPGTLINGQRTVRWSVGPLPYETAR